MEENNIRKYAQLMKELGLTGLEITEDGNKIRLERSEGVKVVEAPPAVHEIQKAKGDTPKTDKDLIEVASPMVGVLYLSFKEGEKPFVKEGDSVKKGDVLCIIEAMKLMNEITAEQDGVIAEVCAGNGEVVDYGRVLFKIRRNEA
ncbi:acetyl-CoA carboxylase biotin carboxyl carrier protein [Parasporobacterium paucivorans]|uniref:Biotin carboxyl carrier protein of acetyl-CoA carboxylase n=1 Tax=Parasporobacterium paucivorans DSM 15970 TaxID=1122934 RepID=A0A1M6KCL5_9FIRM|nr:acetyl-CoA carboxylase biotin carboxyl carrier protein subunit [Parasporobacterium paucivorans]SHJ56567.1 biotin carboxyl carrier protein [Parasporobacterium paucivorans DSM 15970]